MKNNCHKYSEAFGLCVDVTPDAQSAPGRVT